MEKIIAIFLLYSMVYVSSVFAACNPLMPVVRENPTSVFCELPGTEETYWLTGSDKFAVVYIDKDVQTFEEAPGAMLVLVAEALTEEGKKRYNAPERTCVRYVYRVYYQDYYVDRSYEYEDNEGNLLLEENIPRDKQQICKFSAGDMNSKIVEDAKMLIEYNKVMSTDNEEW